VAGLETELHGKIDAQGRDMPAHFSSMASDIQTAVDEQMEALKAADAARAEQFVAIKLSHEGMWQAIADHQAAAPPGAVRLPSPAEAARAAAAAKKKGGASRRFSLFGGGSGGEGAARERADSNVSNTSESSGGGGLQHPRGRSRQLPGSLPAARHQIAACLPPCLGSARG
jgi:hypothetical protein